MDFCPSVDHGQKNTKNVTEILEELKLTKYQNNLVGQNTDKLLGILSVGILSYHRYVQLNKKLWDRW